MKYILVSGGVVSGIGKGVIASSTGLLLKTTGLKVTSIKIDPYMNIDAGTMRPQEHGMGATLRFVTYEIVPHVTTAIQNWIERVAKLPVDDTNEEPDICIIELGGTVGDIESAPFVEAMRQFQFRVGHGNFALIHVSLVPDMHGEQKTKPTQATVRDLRGLGLMPDLVTCRVLVRKPLSIETKRKISMFCHVAEEQVIGIHDVSSVYHVPLLLQEQGIIPFLQRKLELKNVPISKDLLEKGSRLMTRWKGMTDVIGWVQVCEEI
ncbi:CTP synthase ura7 [Serendipita sp. 399]|nr:CTP synthase ura7 [Serendipita sp. 399]